MSQFLRYSFMFILTAAFLHAAGQKTDKVHLKNGDIITGEIKSMKLAMLTFKMDGPGTISIKWEEVIRIQSNKVFEFTLRWGTLTVSTVDSLFSNFHIISLDDIIEIIPIKDRFLKRLSGDFDLGFNYTKSNNILQSNFSSNVRYKVPKLEVQLKLNSVLTNYGDDTSLTSKEDIIFSVTKYNDKRFFLGSYLGWQRNTELGLANRYLLSGVAGLEILTNNHNQLTTGAGLSFNEEQSVESSQFTGNLDGLLNISYKRFYYSAPKLSITADYLLYPGLTDWGRIRMQFDTNVSIEVFKDFMVGLVFYYSFDNHPPEGSQSNNDSGVLFTLGYFFGK
jgi:Protein of unknown function, DUF481